MPAHSAAGGGLRCRGGPVGAAARFAGGSGCRCGGDGRTASGWGSCCPAWAAPRKTGLHRCASQRASSCVAGMFAATRRSNSCASIPLCSDGVGQGCVEALLGRAAAVRMGGCFRQLACCMRRWPTAVHVHSIPIYPSESDRTLNMPTRPAASRQVLQAAVRQHEGAHGGGRGAACARSGLCR